MPVSSNLDIYPSENNWLTVKNVSAINNDFQLLDVKRHSASFHAKYLLYERGKENKVIACKSETLRSRV